jgi:hypothetical protein
MRTIAFVAFMKDKRRRAATAGALAFFVMALASPACLSQAASSRSITQGRAQTQIENMFECPGGSLVRPAGFGTIKSTDGKMWTVPADTKFRDGRRAPDLYNECSKATPGKLSEVRIDDIPIVTIDPDGEVITGVLIADNYFELYVNGTLVGVDATPFTPFNSSIVRFQAKRPITYAVKLVDWEEHLGLGTERGGRAPTHPGDGGFIAHFSDGTRTDGSWKAQSFYIAPLTSPDEVVENGAVHDTPKLGRTYPEAPDNADCADRCYAVHYPIPHDWQARGFDDGAWPSAFEFTLAQMGAERLKAYTNFREAFGDARVIWSKNLVLDNVVLARKVVR